MPPVTITEDALLYGKLSIPWASTRQVGVSRNASPRTGGVSYLMHLTYQVSGSDKVKELVFIIPSVEHPLVHALRERLPQGWVGVDEMGALRKKLGISNLTTYAILAGIFALVFLIVGFIVVRSI